MFEKESLVVVRARMPYVDRRSLSEAWFSSLHLANGTSRANAVRTRLVPQLARPSAVASHRAASAAHGALVASRLRPALRTCDGAVANEPCRRGERAVAARTAPIAAERSRSYPAHRTSLTLGVAGERVQLVLRREGNVLHVVALCRPEVARVVRRALACADEHLRARGDVLRSTVNDVETPAVRT